MKNNWSFLGAWSLVFWSFRAGRGRGRSATELGLVPGRPMVCRQPFASDKDGVIKPIQLRFDARGRLWVIAARSIPQIEPGQVPNDKVLILEDTDGDGRCDKTTVFADDLMIPTGIELGNDGAYVGQGTELLHLKDTTATT